MSLAQIDSRPPAFSPPTFSPPAPIPVSGPISQIELLRRLWVNPITTWTRQNYEQPVLESDGLLGRLLILNDPAAIRHVFVDNAANYRKDALQLRILRPGLGNGLLTADGDDWRVQRRALAPLFTPRTVDAFLPAMNETAEWLLARWEPLRDARRLDVASEMSHAALDVLERTIFPRGLGRDPSQFARAASEYFESFGRLHPLDLINAPKWMPRLGRKTSASAMRFFGEAVDNIIATRRAEPASSQEAPHSDLLSLLLDARDPQTGLGLGEDEIRANILTFIGAGHETTANALTWSLYLLANDPQWRDSVEREIDSVMGAGRVDAGALAQLVRTRATLDEALRLYPPAPTLSREAIADDVAAGRRVRAGATIIVSPWVLHRHQKLWDAPEMFDPARFMPGRIEAIDRFAYMPFGAGPRICIGMGFALREATVLLASILRQYRFEMAPGHVVEPVQRLTLRPRGGMPMLLRRR